ncbi:MAG: ammonium transporter [Saprospiraceae bacterium]|nr:ammonium transporter [Saprospiraceae bacterium]
MEVLNFTVNNLWMMISIFLVFIMHLGFACLESGMTRGKNTVNILFKNVIILAIGLLTYTILGFSLMYPGEAFAGDWFGFAGFGVPVADADVTPEYGDMTKWTDFLFQAMFAATAATIVSGAVAERIKLWPFFIFSILYVAFIYPIVGMWKWGGGWLHTLDTPFYDFAGSTLVHSVGGWAALVAIFLLGSRIGKYKDGKTFAIAGHNMPLATIGVFLLWFGWFGFNGGSVLSADPAGVSKVLVTTCLAAAAGTVSAFLVSYIMYKNFDLSMALNGILAGLVGITAGADQMGILDSIWIGLVAGAIVVFGIALLDKLKLDDPVGAIPVHLFCGIWGTLAVGIFGDLAGGKQIVSQLVGIATIGGICVVASFIIIGGLKALGGIRVPEEEELVGLDRSEHGMLAYPDFRMDDH